VAAGIAFALEGTPEPGTRRFRRRRVRCSGNAMTHDTDSSEPRCGWNAAVDAAFLRRMRICLCVAALAIAAFTLADVPLLARGAWHTGLVRVVQFAVIGLGWRLLRRPMPRGAHFVWATTLVCTLYVTSAIAGVLRHEVATQPITGLAIAFITATLLQWGVWPQLVSVLVAMASIATAQWAVHGDVLRGQDPHMAAGLAVAFCASVLIADQLDRHRRARDHAEALLRRSEERFRALIEGGSEIITIIDAEGQITYESPSLERLFGWTSADAVGQLASAWVHPDDLARVGEAWAAALLGDSRPYESRVRHRDGSWIDVEGVFTNLLDHPAVRGVVVNWRDISERKRAERERARYIHDLARARDRALASTRAKSMFLANVSHEIRTPMNVIIGMTEMALDADLPDDVTDCLRRVHAAAIGLLGIINDILDASKIEAGKLRLERVDVDLRQTIGDAVALHANAAIAKGIALRCTLDDAVPVQVKADPVRLRQTLVNLVANAVKFTEEGRVDVAATVARRQGVQVVVRVEVADTGVGIPWERQAAIFESFTQAEESTSRRYGGTGLGLAICRQLVELMGGRIGVVSTPGAGSTFWFEVPLEVRPRAEAA
jgi:PAS domain S-box-containing protein